MNVVIQEFAVGMELGSKGVEFRLRKRKGDGQVGDLSITSTQLIWCPGRAKRTSPKAKAIKLEDLIAYMESLP